MVIRTLHTADNIVKGVLLWTTDSLLQ